MEKPVVLEGVCCQHDDQCLDRIYWAFWDSRHISPPSVEWPGGKFDNKGLWTLKDGDHFTVFDKKTGKKVVWSGFISLWTDRKGRIHQRDVSGKKWARWFQKEHPAKFTPGPNQTKKPA